MIDQKEEKVVAETTKGFSISSVKHASYAARKFVVLGDLIASLLQTFNTADSGKLQVTYTERPGQPVEIQLKRTWWRKILKFPAKTLTIPTTLLIAEITSERPMTMRCTRAYAEEHGLIIIEKEITE